MPAFKISSFSVIISFVCLSVIGYSLIPQVKVQIYPPPSSPGLSLSFNWPNTAARIVEHEVTSKLEGAVQFVAGIKQVSSVSRYGYGRIDLTFRKAADLDAARFEIAMLIRRSYSKLPEGVSYPELSYSASGQTSPLMSYNLFAGTTPFALRQYCEQRIVPRLSRIRGVDKVVVYGASPYEWEVTFDDQAAGNLGLSGGDIAGQLKTYYSRAFIGRADLPSAGRQHPREVDLVLKLSGSSPGEPGDIPIKKTGERIIYLRDVAKVRVKEQEPDAYFRVNGLNTVSIVAYAQKDANVLAVAGQVQEQMAAFGKELPRDYSLRLAYDAVGRLREELADKGLRMMFSFVLILLAVLAAYRSAGNLLVLLAGVLVNLALTCLAVYILGIEMHLYSFAGLAVSFILVINQAVFMRGHVGRTGNGKAFPVMLATALMAAGAMGTLFLLDEKQRPQLLDFLTFVSISLFASALAAPLLIPALAGKAAATPAKPFGSRRRTYRYAYRYRQYVAAGRKFKWVFIVALVFAFGVPVHWLPEEIEGEEGWAVTYNQALEKLSFNENLRPFLEKALGGALQLFSDQVYEDAFFPETTRTTVVVNARMPEGCTIGQLNEVTQQMEAFLSQFKEIETFQTSVNGPQHAAIAVHFKGEYEKTDFPYVLKTQLEARAMGVGGVDWSIYGVGQSFSNAVNAEYKNNQIIVHGYNYDKLYQYASALKEKILKNPRVTGIDIEGSDNWEEHARSEYLFRKDSTALALYDFALSRLYDYLAREAYQQPAGSFYLDGEYRKLKVTSSAYPQFNVWRFNNDPFSGPAKPFRAALLGKITKEKSGNAIYKFDQQYQLVVAYHFIGTPEAARKAKESYTREMEDMLPVGYKVYAKAQGNRDKPARTPYYLLLLLVVIIYCTCCILFESFTLPLSVLLLIPFSFIGVFLTFYLLDLTFDQGAYTAFVLLCLLAVVPALYIVNDFNAYRKAGARRRPLHVYLKAYHHNSKVVLLSFLATVSGLSPFLLDGTKDAFWFAFASCLTGGLLFALIGLVLFLPLILHLGSVAGKKTIRY